jgi:hypothetical protein
MDCGLVRAMTPVPKPRAITGIAGVIPDQRARAAALGERERQRSMTAPRAAGAEYRSHGPPAVPCGAQCPRRALALEPARHRMATIRSTCACDRGGAPSALAAPAFRRSSSTTGEAGWRGRRVREALCLSACSSLTVVRAECRTDRGTSLLFSAVSPAATDEPDSCLLPARSICRRCIGASRSHRRYVRGCCCSWARTRPLRDSTRWTVALDGAGSSPRPDSLWEIRRAPHRGCRRRSSQISASTSADRRVGLFRGWLERSSRPGIPSCSNRRRQPCRIWREVQYRAATSPIGDLPSTSRTARKRNSANCCTSTTPTEAPLPRRQLGDSGRSAERVNHVQSTTG